MSVPSLRAYLSFLILLACSVTSRGAGLLVADGGMGGLLETKEQVVNVTINNGIAVTQVEQTFLNTENRIVEALYTFPVPKGASVSNFSMWIDGKEMIGEVVEKERAREIYNSYKRQRVDPGLLEQVDYKTFEMRIFPIAAGAEQRVRFCYYQQLDFDHDQVTYVYPLATVSRGGVNSQTTERLALTMRVLSEIPIDRIDSPSHGDEFVVAAHSDRYYEASYETTSGDLAKDFVLSYETRRAKTGVDVVTSHPQGEDGYFMMTITAGDELEEFDEAMDYVFVLDISGSMAHHGKLGLSRNTIASFIEALSPDDRFEVLTFNISPTTLFNGLRPADEASLETATTFLRSQAARGGTALAPAMQTAYKYGEPDRPLNVVVLSDGMTEQSERTALLQLIQSRPTNATVFTIGIGNEVNRPLLRQLAEDAGGLAAFVSRGDDFDRQARAFRRKLTRPAAANVELSVMGAEAYDMVPAKLPNLYHGMPIRVFGRYQNGGPQLTVELNAEVRGRAMTIQETLPIRGQDNPEVERMWAFSRIQELLADADRQGSREAVKDRVIALGEDYSIATEYTSFLVLENNGEYKRWKIERRNSRRLGRDRKNQRALQQRFEKLRAKSLASAGPRSVNQAPQQSQPAQKSWHELSNSPKAINTPEPSGFSLLLITLWPLIHVWRKRSVR